MGSGAMQSAGTGAATGAAAGSVVGPWGTAIGAVVGGAAGYMQGMAADKKKAKQKAAAKKYQQALQAYGQQSGQLSDYTSGQAQGVDSELRGASDAFLQQYPHSADILSQQMPARAAQLDSAMQPAFQGAPPAAGPGVGGAEQNYMAALQADRHRRATESAAPAAQGLAMGDVSNQEHEYALAFAMKQMELRRRLQVLQRLHSLQQGGYQEQLAAASGQHAVASAKAANAGSDQMLYGGLLQSGLGMGASLAAARAPAAKPATSAIV